MNKIKEKTSKRINNYNKEKMDNRKMDMVNDMVYKNYEDTARKWNSLLKQAAQTELKKDRK